MKRIRLGFLVVLVADKTGEAVKILEHSLESNPYYRVSIAALINFCERLGDLAKAQKYERLLERLNRG